MSQQLRRLPTILLGLLLVVSSPFLHADQSLSMGIFPYFDSSRLAALHKPLKNHLAQGVEQSIRLRSAPSFKAFKQRTAEKRYDIVVTAPHLGRVAELKAGYQWLAFTSNFSHAVFVSHHNHGVTSIEELKGKTLALPPKGTIIHHLALATLEARGFTPGKDVSILTLSSHNNAMLAALRGDAEAAAFGRPTWRRYKAPDKENLLMLGTSENIPGFAILVHPRLGQALINKLSESLFEFPETEAGKHYFQATGLDGVRSVSDKDMQQMDNYLSRIAAARKGS